MKKRILFLVLGCSVLLAVFSCNQHQEHMSADAAVSLESADTNSASAEKIEGQQAVERKIIKEGSIRFETDAASETRKQITAALATYKGYVSQDHAETYASQSVYTLTVRVPAENFEKLLSDITTAAKKVENQDIRALDVTEEFIDVESRIHTKKELENRYKALLSKANKVEEILSIEKEIEALRSDIESYEGRLNYLKNSVAYSTLTVVFYEKQTSTSTFGYEFSTAFKEGWSNLVSFTLGLFYIWPFILITIGVLYLVRRRIKRRKNK
ncbi:DUF4349 domain-containing protein [Myroides sp. WP-1]|uniref:DUF4349 domain-containing protein n=1 Tax=Myroides sp. WP-1 TaxID=2759944 RepID=UPI0015FC4A23|nr:DUF4349 domain-containing protein [Myroides sp. WP-1]MBB1139529.1 DUF4349 domain-containing protein [Myroides sp. WP-1]